MTQDITVATQSSLEKYKEYQDFITEHGSRILSVDRDYKSIEQLYELVDAVPDELPQKDNLYDMLNRLNPNKKGVMSERATAFHTSLYLYQGTGNNPNRPEDLIPGEMHYDSGDKVGKEFIGTPLLIWEGRECRRELEDKTSQLMCYSSDRKVGNFYGKCQMCPYFPFKNKPEKGEPKCTNSVSAFMLSQDAKEIVLVRFKGTSSNTGAQLLKYAARTPQLWSKWYRIGTTSQVSSDKKFRWFTFTVGTITGEEGVVPKDLHPICDAFYCAAARDYVFPNIARCYAGTTDTDEAATSKGVDVVTEATDSGFGYEKDINADV